MTMDLEFREAPGRPIKGIVVQTPADAPEDASKEDLSLIKIKLDEIPEDVDADTLGMAIGAKVQVNILLDSRVNVIVLPSRYLSKVSTRMYVRVLIDGLPEERDVIIGIFNGSEYEIISGLEAGEELVA